MSVYYGETVCQIITSKGVQCTNKAYFMSDGILTCGVHCKKANVVNKLPKNPNKLENHKKELTERKSEIILVAKNNRENGKLGSVKVTKMYMMKSPEYIEGYLNIFPNYKHQNRQDGLGCMRLSPKSLGPVVHNMPNLPDATTIENYHQFAKFWRFELDDESNILEKYKLERIKAYTAEPVRHKYDKKTLLQYNKNINVPEFSMYYDKDGNEHRYNYLQSRYFYCHFYELLAKLEPDFTKLEKLINLGYNLNICGYDGYDITNNLMEHYLDISRPFGHELVLYTMLTIDNPDYYPWNIYYNENKEIYKNVI